MTNFFERLKHFQPQFFPILSGLLVATSYPPFASWAVTFCWVPLWFAIVDEESIKKVFLKAWVTQFVLSLIGFHWIAYTANAFGSIPWPVAVLALVLFAAFMHLHIPVSLALAKWIDRKTHGLATGPVFFVLCALVMGLVERVWPMIFPWHLGYGVLFTRLEIAQLAELVGFQGLSTWFFLFNALFASGIWLLKAKRGQGITLIVAGILGFFLLNVAGHFLRPVESGNRGLNVLMVQANIGQFEKIMAEKNLTALGGAVQEVVLQKYFELTDEALIAHPEAQVIVWPETALPDYLDQDFLSKERQMRLRRKISEWDRALMTGAYSKDPKSGLVYNALFVFNPNGELAAPAYRKSELLAFGEYLPFGETFPVLYSIFPFASSFGRGPGPEIKSFTTSGQVYNVAPQICYESLDDSFARRGALKGADFLVNVTNDSWFGTWFEPFQHGTMNWARAIETRRPLVRSTNTGQSSVILHTGQVVLKSPLQQEWYGNVQMPLPENKITFFMAWGYLDWSLYLVILLILIGRLRAKHPRV